MKYIYTAMFRGYDNLLEQQRIPGYKYVAFTDQDLKSDTWEIRKVAYYEKCFRHIKTCPHLFLPDWTEAIWLDANIELKSDEAYKGKTFCIMEHPHRDKLHDEVLACVKYKKDKPEVMFDQMMHYRQQGYHGLGMVASGMIYRINNPAIVQFGEAWWKEIQKWSIRDQLSFNYVSWKLGIGYQTVPFLHNAIKHNHNYRWKP